MRLVPAATEAKTPLCFESTEDVRREVPVVRVRVFDSCDQRAVVDGGESAKARDVGVDEFEDNRGWKGEVGIGDDLEEGEKR